MARNIDITPGYMLFVLAILGALFGGSYLLAWLRAPPAGGPAASPPSRAASPDVRPASTPAAEDELLHAMTASASVGTSGPRPHARASGAAGPGAPRRALAPAPRTR